MGNMENEMLVTMEIFEYIGKHNDELTFLDMMLYAQVMMEAADKLKPIYVKLHQQRNESFIVKL